MMLFFVITWGVYNGVAHIFIYNAHFSPKQEFLQCNELESMSNSSR